MKPKKTESAAIHSVIRKGALLTVIVLLLIAAAWANERLHSATPTSVTTPPPPVSGDRSAAPSPQAGDTPASAPKDYFASLRAERAALRERTTATLDEVIDGSTDPAAVSAASKAKIALADAMEKEFALEEILKAKGYTDAAVIIQEDLVSVVVKKAELDATDAAKILQAAQDVTREDAANIKIIPAP